MPIKEHNSDIIRRMTDSELVDLFTQTDGCPPDVDRCHTSHDCKKCWQIWITSATLNRTGDPTT